MIVLKTFIFKDVHRNGKVTWRVRWKDPKTRTWHSVTAGRTIDEARVFEAKIRDEILKGRDPLKREETENLTVEEVIQRFLAHSRFLGGSKRWREEVQRKIKNWIQPALGSEVFRTLSQISGPYRAQKIGSSESEVDRC